MFYGGIMAGRALNGFLSVKLKGETLIRGGLVIIITGGVLLLLNLPGAFQLIGMALFGLGCAPIFPTVLYLTPQRFGSRGSSAVMGLQMSVAYIGGIVPTFFGYAASSTSFILFPFIIIAFAVLIFICNERAIRLTTKNE